MTLDSAGLDALIADVEGASNESFRRDWLLLRLRYARSLAAAAPPTGENPDGPMTEALWKYAQNEWGWGADDYEACRDAITAVVAAGRAAATPDPPKDERRPWPIAPDTVMPPRRQPVRWGSRADDPPTEIHDDPEKTKAYLAGLAAGRTEAAAASPDERLREALAFYADKGNYTAQNPVGSGAHVWRDMGGRARAALAATDREKPKAEERARIVKELREAAHGGNRGQPGSFWVGWRAAARAIEEGWVGKPETPFFTEQQERALDRCEEFDAANPEKPETDT